MAEHWQFALFWPGLCDSTALPQRWMWLGELYLHGAPRAVWTLAEIGLFVALLNPLALYSNF
jgi:hypothetical protein